MPPVPPEVLLPLGAGAVALVVALLVVLLVRRSRRRRHATATADALTAPPTSGDAVDNAPGAERGEQAGSGRTVVTAVERAFAAREVHAGTRGDARDRLLTVLLDDPALAVAAAVELEACRRQLDRLGDAVRHERATLGGVLGRLSSAGLDAEQLARLSGLPDDELRRLLSEGTTTR